MSQKTIKNRQLKRLGLLINEFQEISQQLQTKHEQLSEKIRRLQS